MFEFVHHRVATPFTLYRHEASRGLFATAELLVAVLDVSLAVNLCINCSFLHLYLQFYYISELLQQNCFFGLLSQIIRPNWN